MSSETPITDVSPAPGEPEHVALALANSTYVLPRHGRSDLLVNADAARGWLAAQGLAPEDADVRDVCASRIRDLRTHVRSLLDAHVEERTAPTEAVDAVNDALASAPSAVLLHQDAEGRWSRATAHPVTQLVDRALAVMAADLADLLAGADADLLTRCGAPGCERYLLRTHGRRTWCSVRCGDRVRAARSYAKRGGHGNGVRSTTG